MTGEAQCLSNPDLNAKFASHTNSTAETAASCCMKEVCGLECPLEPSPPSFGYGIAVIVFVVFSFLIGISTFIFVKGQTVNFFVAGRSLPLWIVSLTLTAQAIDSNALLGNVDLAFQYSFYDGAVIPIGLGVSLILNGLFLAHHINKDAVMTLPDVLAKRYGRVVEVLVSCATLASFLLLLAGNLLGVGAITSYLWGITGTQAIWTAASVICCYTISGGLFSVAYTGIVQSVLGLSGCVVMTYWFIANEPFTAPPPSVGFPNYTYPDTFGDGGACDLYNGTKCSHSQGCCYNTDLWCPDFSQNGGVCDRYDRGAYPSGDVGMHQNQMVNPYALDPEPNAIVWDWATIFILGVGNLAALDFQARSMASKTPKIARRGNFIAGLLVIFIGVPFAYLGATTRVYYGADSVYSSYNADSCHLLYDRPTCAQWNPDPNAFLMLLAHQAPPVLGAWCFIGIISASMSTADGAVLAMGTVLSHNILRQLDTWFPQIITPDNLLMMARLATIPCTLASTLVAAYYHSSRPGGGTGALLIVAFDVVLATVVVPLVGCFYTNSPSPRAALLAILCGGTCRLILQFALPKDGYKIWPFSGPEFYDFGPAASADYPSFMDVPLNWTWNVTAQPCEQRQYKDYTGMDSVASFVLAIVVFISVQYYEYKYNRSLFKFAEDIQPNRRFRGSGDCPPPPSLSSEMGILLNTLRMSVHKSVESTVGESPDISLSSKHKIVNAIATDPVADVGDPGCASSEEIKHFAREQANISHLVQHQGPKLFEVAGSDCEYSECDEPPEQPDLNEESLASMRSATGEDESEHSNCGSSTAVDEKCDVQASSSFESNGKNSVVVNEARVEDKPSADSEEC